MRRITSLYHPSYLRSLVYMLQQSEYRSGVYLKWLWRVKDFSRIQNRGSIELTKAARLVLLSSYAITLALVAFFVYAFYNWGVIEPSDLIAFVSLLGLFATPVLVAHIIIIPSELGRLFIIKPSAKRRNLRAQEIFASTKATKIAIAGSYGKTTMKEVLATVLMEGKQVAYSQANLNTAIAHAWFADDLTGKEEVLILEYGEYMPGDIAKFNDVYGPEIGIITGLNEAHLDNFKTLDVSAKNILSLKNYVKEGDYFLNGDSEKLMKYAAGNKFTYSAKSVDGWKITDENVSVDGTKFTIKKGRKTIKVESGLLGRHNIGTLALAAIIAMRLGLSKKQIEAGLAKTQAFEHRMKPETRHDGVVLIDDTYNGNIDGIKAGAQLLDEIKAKRKIYVTPGLVEQGSQTENVHIQLGKYVAPVADVVVLMQNSVTDYIVKGLKSGGFKGDLLTVEDPLKFYKNLNQFTAAGDVVLMQNDWPDLYA